MMEFQLTDNWPWIPRVHCIDHMNKLVRVLHGLCYYGAALLNIDGREAGGDIQD
jgi:hypothetical protein